MASSDRFLLPIVPQIHGSSCSTFKMPPLGGSLTLPELYEWHAEHCPEHPLFVFAQEDGSLHKICWPEVLRAVYTGVKIIRDRTHWQAGMTKAPVVAILSNSDSVPYATTTMAIMRANCTAFLISSRNSPAAVAHLLNKVGAQHLLIGDEPSMTGLCKESLDILKTQYSEATVPETSAMLGFGELYLPVSQNPSRNDVPYEYKGAEEPAVILHSSGSYHPYFRVSSAQNLVSWLFSCLVRLLTRWARVPSVTPFLAEVSRDWEYLKLPRHISAKMIPSGEGAFELVILANEYGCLSVFNTNIDGVDAYATSDLLVEHPTKSGYWKVIGRVDDQIMHSTGEKTNPDPLEAIMNLDPHVSASLMFGRGRFQVGMLINPKADHVFDILDEGKLPEFRNKVWPTVEKMNKLAPQHSRLFKEMILVTRPTKPFSYTAKHSIRRGAIIRDYEDEIAALYDTVDASAQSSIQPPTDWALPATIEYVRTVVGKVMVHPVTDNDDVFQHGCDSLQATYIRNMILRALRDTTKMDTRNIGDGFVYDHPTISSLAAFVSSIAQGMHDAAAAGPTTSARILSMRAMLAKYSAHFSARPQTLLPSQPERDVVLVTGTTGSLGCHLLALLVADPKVGRVYAFNRPAKSQMPLRERQKLALADRGLDACIVDLEKVVLLEGSLTSGNLGLEEIMYEKVASPSTNNLYTAWRVDFVINLESFEDSIAGVRRLVDFALTSPLPQPPRVLLESSIGVFQSSSVTSDVVFTEGPIEPDLAAGTGYGESKWVSEQILYAAATKASLNTLVVRVGQVCGGLDGVWNVHEWFPTLVQSAPRLQCFPDDNKEVNWVPVEIAAGAIIDLRHHTSNTTRTVHLVHPRPVSWHSLASAIASELAVPLVSYSEWLAKLEQAHQADNDLGNTEQGNSRDLRALQLLPFFRSVANKIHLTRMAMGMPTLSIEHALLRSPTLADPTVCQLGEEDVK
ncbi:predicted protein, partial [Postia placenta Mad-698-R]